MSARPHHRRFVLSAITLVGSLASCVGTAAQAGAVEKGTDEPLLVYVGTYTGGDSKGIYLCRLDLKTGDLTLSGVAAETPNPSFLAIAPSRRFLYAVGELSDFGGQPTGGVTAFAIDPKTGMLTQLNQQSSQGNGPCHLSVDNQGKSLLVANYGAGSVAAYPIEDDGSLGSATSAIQHEGSSVNKSRQEGPHAHSINFDPANRFAFAADLGLDKVLVYRFNAAHSTLKPNDPPAVTVAPGSGPRHFAFHPSAKFAYVINEMANTVTGFNYNAQHGVLKEIETVSTLPKDFKGVSYTAEVQVHPSGKFLYGSNRGHDSLAIFAIDAKSGRLTSVGHQPTGGKTPRNFGIDPTGRFVLAANQDTNTIVVFEVNPDTGELTDTGKMAEVPFPVCVKMTHLPE